VKIAARKIDSCIIEFKSTDYLDKDLVSEIILYLLIDLSKDSLLMVAGYGLIVE